MRRTLGFLLIGLLALAPPAWAIDFTPTGLVLTVSQKRALVKAWLQQKFLRGG